MYGRSYQQAHPHAFIGPKHFFTFRAGLDSKNNLKLFPEGVAERFLENQTPSSLSGEPRASLSSPHAYAPKHGTYCCKLKVGLGL